LTPSGPAAKIGARATKGATVMSELDVIVIHIRAGQAAEYERLFAERELPRRREYKERGAFISARIFRAAFGTGPRQDIAKYVIAVEVPATPSTASTTLIPGSRSSTGSPTHSSRRLRWCTADRCCTLSDRHSASASAPGCHNADHPERLLMKRAGNAIPGRSSGRPGQPRNRGDGGQPPGLITERDERMKCLYGTASPAGSECLASCGIRAGHRARITHR